MVNKPNNVEDHFEQLRPPIVRSEGLTESERYLAKLADDTFLNLWSYPNPHRSQKLSGKGDGKEVCDLLVVCDPHVLIFSEKEVGWTDKPVDVAWARWARGAIQEAAKQLKGAERWIHEFPDRIFLDKLCEIPFPLAFPPVERRKMHRIIVATGAEEAGRKHFDGGLGTFVVRPSIKGADHFNQAATSFEPFAIGDIDPSNDFVHVFDRVSLDIVMAELDTISDFTAYLDKRAEFIRSGRLEVAHGEEDLLAYYAVRLNSEGEHDFAAPEGHSWEDIDKISIGSGNWARYVSHPQYLAKKEADRISYAWDGLIDTFTKHLLGGTSIVLPGHTYSLTNSEIAVRHMALQNRYIRRAHSEAVIGALDLGRNKPVFFRAMISPIGSKNCETGFFFLTLQYMPWMDDRGGYEKYRQMRAFYLQSYAQSLLMRHNYLEQIIGIATEPPGHGNGSSEDIIYAQQTQWTDADRRRVRKDCADLGIMRKLKKKNYREQEYPDVNSIPVDRPFGNRKERRKQAARKRKL